MKPEAEHLSPPSARPSLVPEGINLAASWYIALGSHELGSKPRPLKLFGQPLVAWRDGGGQPVIMPRYCPHMGASLALGKVVDGCLQCPFHHWRFRSSGACAHIPGVERIPAIARQPTYPVVERYDYVWIWYGSASPMFALPEFPACDDQRNDYMRFRYADHTTGSVRRVLENAYDYYHFLTLHSLPVHPVALHFLQDQHAARDNGPPISAEAWLGALVEGTLIQYDPVAHPIKALHSAVAAFGKGDKFQILVDGWPGGQRFTIYVDGREISKVLLGMTPIAENQTIQQGWALVKKTGRRWKDLLYYFLSYVQNRGGTMQDIPIYDTMRTDGDDIYVKYDKSLLRFREYYQAWVDRARPEPGA